MSSSHLIEWFDRILFGYAGQQTPPHELNGLLLRMETDHIPWEHIMGQGGLTAFPYQVHGDLNVLIDHLEKKWLDHFPVSQPSSLKTRAISKFWQQLQLLLAQFKDSLETIQPNEDDDDILKILLTDPSQSSFSYSSASFWGSIARQSLDIRRPLNPPPQMLSLLASDAKRAVLLYDITCQSRGQYFDPLSMHLVPHSEYINAAHWQSGQSLQSFMHHQPNHPMTQSVQDLLTNTIQQLLNGQKPTALVTSNPALDALLHNIQVIHSSVQQVPQTRAPPKLVDVFQRLLALCERDHLWESEMPAIPKTTSVKGLDLFHLTKQLQTAERHNQMLWKCLDDAKSFP